MQTQRRGASEAIFVMAIALGVLSISPHASSAVSSGGDRRVVVGQNQRERYDDDRRGFSREERVEPSRARYTEEARPGPGVARPEEEVRNEDTHDWHPLPRIRDLRRSYRDHNRGNIRGRPEFENFNRPRTDEDEDLKERIERRLTWTPFVDADYIIVSANDGVAVLNGWVEDDTEMRDAEDHAWAAGADEVVNRLRRMYYHPDIPPPWYWLFPSVWRQDDDD